MMFLWAAQKSSQHSGVTGLKPWVKRCGSSSLSMLALLLCEDKHRHIVKQNATLTCISFSFLFLHTGGYRNILPVQDAVNHTQDNPSKYKLSLLCFSMIIVERFENKYYCIPLTPLDEGGNTGGLLWATVIVQIKKQGPCSHLQCKDWKTGVTERKPPPAQRDSRRACVAPWLPLHLI